MHNLEPILVGVNNNTAQLYAANWEEAKTDLQRVINSYSVVGLTELENIDEVAMFLTVTEQFVYNKMTGGGVSVKGLNTAELSVNTSAAMALLNKPAGYDNLLLAVDEYKKNIKAGYGQSHTTEKVVFLISDVKKYFDYNSGKLDYSEMLKNKIEESGKIYVKTAKGQSIYRFLEKVSKAASEENIDKITGISMGSNDRRITTDALFGILVRYMSFIDKTTGKPVLLLNSYDNKPMLDKG